jgi:hypothetical protein
MISIKTDAIRVFQKRVHELNSANQRDMRLTAQEARNLSNELALLCALLLELQTASKPEENIQITMTGSKF